MKETPRGSQNKHGYTDVRAEIHVDTVESDLLLALCGALDDLGLVGPGQRAHPKCFPIRSSTKPYVELHVVWGTTRSRRQRDALKTSVRKQPLAEIMNVTGWKRKAYDKLSGQLGEPGKVSD